MFCIIRIKMLVNARVLRISSVCVCEVCAFVAITAANAFLE